MNNIWNRVTGQDYAINQLKKSVTNPYQAWLFIESFGVSNFNIAKIFAASLACGTKEPCGACQSCTKILHDSHPDVNILYPKGFTISINEIRKLVNLSYNAPSISLWRVIIIKNAELMTERTSNVLLKALEDSSLQTIWILCSKNLNSLPITIRSRCNILHINSESQYILNNIIAIDEFTDIDTFKKICIPLTLGEAIRNADYIDKKVKMQKIDSKIIEEQKLKFLKTFGINGKDANIPPYVKTYLKTFENEKKFLNIYNQKKFINEILLKICFFYRDILMIQIGQCSKIICTNMRYEINEIANKSTTKETIKRIESIYKAMKRLKSNCSILITLEQMMIELL